MTSSFRCLAKLDCKSGNAFSSACIAFVLLKFFIEKIVSLAVISLYRQSTSLYEKY